MDNIQNEIWNWITRYDDKWGYPPTRRDVERKFGIGASLTQRHLNELQSAGCIRVDAGKARAIAILRRPEAIP